MARDDDGDVRNVWTKSGRRRWPNARDERSARSVSNTRGEPNPPGPFGACAVCFGGAFRWRARVWRRALFLHTTRRSTCACPHNSARTQQAGARRAEHNDRECVARRTDTSKSRSLCECDTRTTVRLAHDRAVHVPRRAAPRRAARRTEREKGEEQQQNRCERRARPKRTELAAVAAAAGRQRGDEQRRRERAHWQTHE